MFNEMQYELYFRLEITYSHFQLDEEIFLLSVVNRVELVR